MKDCMLTKEQIITAINNIRGGTVARVTYKTEVPIKAAFKKMGYRIIKGVETTARIGVNYGNIASVKSRNEETPYDHTSSRTNNYEWVVKDRIRHNAKTGKDYVVLVGFNKGHHTKVKYLIEGTFVGTIECDDAIDDAYKHLVLESYLSPKTTHPTEIKNVAFENIIRINDMGHKVTF